MLYAADQVIPANWTSVLSYGALGVAALIVIMMVVFFSRSDISLSGTGLALGIVAIGGMLAISFISFITQKQPDQTAEDRQALRTVCALVTGKLATVSDSTAKALAEEMRRVIDGRTSCPKQP